MQLTAIAPQPASLALKPLKPKGSSTTVPSRASCRLLRRGTNHSSPLPAPSNVRRRMGHCSCPAARTKARDEAEPEPPAPAEEGEEASAAGRNRGERSMAYQLFEAVYVCLYVLSWRLGELIVVNAEDALESLRGYVRDKFNRKR